MTRGTIVITISYWIFNRETLNDAIFFTAPHTIRNDRDDLLPLAEKYGYRLRRLREGAAGVVPLSAGALRNRRADTSVSADRAAGASPETGVVVRAGFCSGRRACWGLGGRANSSSFFGAGFL